MQALRRLRAIEECEASRPLELNEVINYAKRCGGAFQAGWEILIQLEMET